MAHAFKIKFWEMFNTPTYYDTLTDNQYKMPNSNDGCMQLRACFGTQAKTVVFKAKTLQP